MQDERESPHRQEIMKVLDNLSELQQTLSEHFGTNEAAPSMRIESTSPQEAISPVKDNFFLSFKGQLEHVLNNKLLSKTESVQKIEEIINFINQMITENKEYRDESVALDDLPDELKDIVRGSTKEGISPTDYINRTVQDEEERKRLLESMIKHMMFQTEVVDGQPVPKYMVKRRVAHLTDTEDFIKQAINLLFEELGQI